jgi:hypothetical protein
MLCLQHGAALLLDWKHHLVQNRDRRGGKGTGAHLVQKEIDEIEAAEKRWRKVDILHNRGSWIIARGPRVGCGQHTRPCIERCDDPRLCHRHCLLLHDFMQLHPAALSLLLLLQCCLFPLALLRQVVLKHSMRPECGVAEFVLKYKGLCAAPGIAV